MRAAYFRYFTIQIVRLALPAVDDFPNSMFLVANWRN